MDKRIYLVTRIDATAVLERMVRAPTSAQALRHVVSECYTVEVCEPEDCIRLASAGVKVEDVA
jgi:hypothetical protein